MNNPLFLSFIIIGLFVYSTFNLYQSLSIEDGDSSSQLNDNQESDNDFFNSLSRTLPSIDEVPSDENEELDNEGGIFNNFNTEEPSKEEGGSSSKKTESNKEIKEGITESLNNGFSDSNQETEIINEKGSSDDIEMSSSNEDNNNKDNDNIDNTEKIEIK
ncbi:MAG TPA: hypothetical protein VF242_00270 [Nitrososphaeraceae archaeon]